MAADGWPDHVETVVLPSGRRVHARGLGRSVAPDPPPEFGVYLLGRRPADVAWAHEWIRWPDFRLPADRPAALASLRRALERSGSERVEIAFRCGRGRTGTALAVMAVADGVAPAAAVEWVRRAHDRRSVETPWQRRWIASLPAS
ncbi:MAG: protein phosphatase [Actinomycetota bacterium]